MKTITITEQTHTHTRITHCTNNKYNNRNQITIDTLIIIMINAIIVSITLYCYYFYYVCYYHKQKYE